MKIYIDIANKKPTPKEDYKIVCGNSDYKIIFTFDKEWDEYKTKTARFNFSQNGVRKYIDVVFDGNECNMPALSKTALVEIGVFAGDLHTTTSCVLRCEKSILCQNGTPEELPENIYNKVIQGIDEVIQMQNQYIQEASK